MQQTWTVYWILNKEGAVVYGGVATDVAKRLNMLVSASRSPSQASYRNPISVFLREQEALGLPIYWKEGGTHLKKSYATQELRASLVGASVLNQRNVNRPRPPFEKVES